MNFVIILAGTSLAAGQPQAIPPAPERITKIEPADAFAKLTANAWGDPNRSFVQFNNDGTYRRKVKTEVSAGECPVGLPNFDHRGQWTMKWKDDHGMIQLETGDMLAFALGKNALFFVDRWLPHIDRNLDPTTKPKLALEDILKFRDQPTYSKLADTNWKKSNSFDVFRLPTKIKLDSFGGLRLEYRDGECRAEGAWSLVDKGTKLLRYYEKDSCDLRRPGVPETGSTDERLDLSEQNVQFFGGDYRPESIKSDKQIFTFDSFSGSVKTTLIWNGSFQKGKTIECEIQFTAVDRDYVLDQIVMEQTECQLIQKGISVKGDTKSIGTIKLNMKLAHGKTTVHKMEFTPAVSGPYIGTNIVFRYQNDRQEYTGRQMFFSAVKE